MAVKMSSSISLSFLSRNFSAISSPPLMSSSKSITDFFSPPPKRIKISETLISKPTTISAHSKSGPDNVDDGSSLSVEQKTKIEFNKSLARAKRNLKICTDRVSKSKEEGKFVKLEELLVEETWIEALSGEFEKAYVKTLSTFVEKEISGNVPIYPPTHLIFNAMNSTPFDRVKAVIIGQDPYHGPGQAMGLSFSVPEGIKIPSSLGNIFKELKQDLGCAIPTHGNLERWALQGVLLLNTVLTVRNHQANSHAKKGWEPFTDAVIRTISLRKSGVIFLLWGNSAQEKSKLIDESKHHILKCAHPSGLSANRGFFDCRHFSKTNHILEQLGVLPVNWQL
ncbi:uracil-DNA glycosylase, mitochondrial-like [Papaver somniferum]|uniref:uracil-DNA glycosylase, mitochondrial-like n=1 Tax=Papaver somniferum TaxID=3469 RepID=UPI000E7000A9|nr:uracil-DNA glycosylase, mitochondrial-like [Papaver somniferum]